ncbi:hypothetical protein CDD82_4518 [Ophiocordyceps australis]|uniref:Uncharacterized protein n=1 Tax=Ophiocordyceps australis TaxID=1399860 RepID=A0A2C5Z650_9HYPO|nr:hypothetical protein CDD82_4518 [Ophiocordyceps australis]
MPWKKMLYGGILLLSLLVVLTGVTIGIGHSEDALSESKYKLQQRAGSELLQAERAVSEAAHQLALRSDCNEASGVGSRDGIAARLPLASGNDGTVTPILPNRTAGSHGETDYLTMPQSTLTALLGSSSKGSAESTPVSTETSLSTVWSLKPTTALSTTLSTIQSTTQSTTHLTKTRTATVSVTLARSNSTSTRCMPKTRTVYVTVSPLANETTVTGQPLTATQLDTLISYTELSYTEHLPIITLTGQASTATALQTDVSYTQGLPDATVSDKPQTETAVDTQVSATKGLPDATVSGDVSTVTNVDASTSTTTSSLVTAFTTLTITDLWGTEAETETETEMQMTQTQSVEMHSTVTIVTHTIVTRETVTVEETLTVQDTATSEASTTTETPVATQTWDTDETTTTETSTIEASVSILTTITISDLFSMPSATTEPGFSSVLGEETSTDDSPSLTPYESYTEPSITSFDPSFGLASASPSLAIVSGASAKPEPKTWGLKGSSNLVCTVMLVAVIALVA